MGMEVVWQLMAPLAFTNIRYEFIYRGISQTGVGVWNIIDRSSYIIGYHRSDLEYYGISQIGAGSIMGYHRLDSMYSL